MKSADEAVMSEDWVDLGGQLMPAQRLLELCQAIESGPISDLAAFHRELDRIERLRAEDEWLWVRQFYSRFFEVDLGKAAATDLVEVANQLLETRTEFLRLVLVDAGKEFDDQSHTGFGIEGVVSAEEDFAAVRGDYDSNSFVSEIRAEIKSLGTRIEKLKQRISERAT
jgi:hypothetical protein